MKRCWLVLLFGVAGMLSACGGSAADCGWAELFQATATPRVSLPTPTIDPLVIPTATPTAMPCPTRTPRPTSLPMPQATAGPGLGNASSSSRNLSFTSGNERLLTVAVGEGRGAVVYLDEGGHLVISPMGNWGHINVASMADQAVLTFGPEQVALVVRIGRQLALRLGANLNDLSSATVLAVPWGGDDLAATYGNEGWLYLASGGQIARLNPFSQQWEFQGNYTGNVLQMQRLGSGALLFLSNDGRGLIYRREPTGGDWQKCWDADDIEIIVDGAERKASPEALAVLGDRVGVVWFIGQGPTGGGGYWQATMSDDGCLHWNEAEEASVGPSPGWHAGAFPAWRTDGELEAIGLFIDANSFVLPIVARRSASGWFPPSERVEPLASLPKTNAIRVASKDGVTLVGLEVEQFNGGTDVVAIAR